ncbi:MAG: 3-dehydroquinate synthase [Planctomycetaceae bacterium]|jgi:3-dehydroquinate synthase|nr:3-dehydroquinate synthase [Planctomycetaceae bacterium]
MPVTVSLASRSYDIAVGSGNLNNAGSLLASFKPVSRAVILTDVNVQSFGYAQSVAAAIADAGIDASILSVPAGEQSKSIETADTLWQTLLEDGTDRKAVLVTVGGGVIGDLGGFVAATYARGIRFFQVPTTLLAQVDSSVGGKVGIDLPNAKNMVGAFHQPLGVLIDTETLQTLSNEQYLCGLGEAVKYGESLDAGLFEYLEENSGKINRRDNEVLQKIVSECCRIKAQIVSEDEYETTGRRILLNYGHTFAHSFETMSGFTLLHGLAVASGAMCAAQLAVKLGLIDDALRQRFEQLHKSLHLPAEIPVNINADEAVALMQHDKKTEFGELNFVLPTGLGQCKTVKCTPQTVRDSVWG